MKKILFLACALLMTFGVMAQHTLNDKADNIVGHYLGVQTHDKFKVSITKQSDGTYKGQIYWMQNPNDKNGKPYLDEKNPDKSLRNVRCDRIVLFSGLRYDPDKKVWTGTKIYDPQRGLRAHVTCHFDTNGKLNLRGTILGIGETAVWTRIKE